MIDITKILRAIASEERNEVGDYWSTDWCNMAAGYIDQLRSGEMYVLHMDVDILLIGTQEECQAKKDAQPFRTDCWKVNKLAEYGQACYDDGYESAEVLGPEY